MKSTTRILGSAVLAVAPRMTGLRQAIDSAIRLDEFQDHLQALGWTAEDAETAAKFIASEAKQSESVLFEREMQQYGISLVRLGCSIDEWLEEMA